MIIVFVLWSWHELLRDIWDPIQLPIFYGFAHILWCLKSWRWCQLYEKQHSETNLPIFWGATISQNSSSVPWGPSHCTKMTVGTLCTLAPCQCKVLSLGDCPYPIIEDVATTLLLHPFLPKAQLNFPLSIHWKIQAIRIFLHIHAFKNH